MNTLQLKVIEFLGEFGIALEGKALDSFLQDVIDDYEDETPEEIAEIIEAQDVIEIFHCWEMGNGSDYLDLD